MTIVCVQCKCEVSLKNFKRHLNSCDEESKKEQINCKFCNEEKKNKNSLRNHERLCSLNPEKQLTPFQDINIQKSKKKSNQYIFAIENGLEKPSLSEEARKTIGACASINNLNRDPEVYKRQTATIRRKVENNEWHLSVRKYIIVEYKGQKFHSHWEVKYAKWLDLNDIEWIRTKDKFPYFWNNAIHYYFPDFYLPASNEYVEIKGYKTERDDAKWTQFPNDKTLVVLLEKDLKKLGIKL
jgi:hypothetical protein